MQVLLPRALLTFLLHLCPSALRVAGRPGHMEDRAPVVWSLRNQISVHSTETGPLPCFQLRWRKGANPHSYERGGGGRMHMDTPVWPSAGPVARTDLGCVRGGWGGGGRGGGKNVSISTGNKCGWNRLGSKCDKKWVWNQGSNRVAPRDVPICCKYGAWLAQWPELIVWWSHLFLHPCQRVHLQAWQPPWPQQSSQHRTCDSMQQPPTRTCSQLGGLEGGCWVRNRKPLSGT